MREILRSTDPVAVSFAEALLGEAGIAYFVADRHMNATEGGIAAFARRVLVPDDAGETARQLLIDAGLGAEVTAGAIPSSTASPRCWTWPWRGRSV